MQLFTCKPSLVSVIVPPSSCSNLPMRIYPGYSMLTGKFPFALSYSFAL